MSTEYPVIFGAAGLSGGMLVRLISGAKINARVSYTEQSELDVLKNLNVEPVFADCNDVDSLAKAMSGATAAALILPMNPDMNNWGRNTIAAAKQTGLSKFILLANNNAVETSSYETPRLQGEIIAALQQSGVPYQIVKSAPYFQHLFWSMINIVRQHQFSMPLGDAELPYIDMHDTAIFVAKLLCENHPNNMVYNITGVNALPMVRVARILSKTLGQDVRYNSVTIQNSTHVFHAMGLSDWLAKAITEVYGEYSGGDYKKPTMDFQNLVGRPPGGLEKFIERNLITLRHDAIPEGLLKTGH